MSDLNRNPTIVVSHSSTDSFIAETLANALDQKSIDTWIAPRDIPIGSNYAAEIGRAITNADFMIVLLTSEAISSPHVKREVNIAVDKGITLLPVLLGEQSDFLQDLPEEWNYWLSVVQILTFTDIENTVSQISKRVESISRITNKSGSPALPKKFTLNSGAAEMKEAEAKAAQAKAAQLRAAEMKEAEAKAAQAKAAQLSEGAPSRKSKKKRLISLGVAGGLVALVTIVVSISGNSTQVRAAEMKVAEAKAAQAKAAAHVASSSSLSWSVQVVGENSTHQGKGDKFEFLLCDQGLKENAIYVESLDDLGVPSSAVNVKVTNGSDCGAGFESIYVSTDQSSPIGTAKYRFFAIPINSVKSIHYDFSVTVSK